jgi:hypothetical protein
MRLLLDPQFAGYGVDLKRDGLFWSTFYATQCFTWATTYIRKDGIIAGEHKVLVQCRPGGLVDKDYDDRNNTPLKVNASRLPFELKVRRPEPDSP